MALNRRKRDANIGYGADHVDCMLPVVNVFQLRGLLLHPAAAHGSSRVLKHRKRYRLHIPDFDCHVRNGLGEHLRHLLSHTKDQRCQEDDDDRACGNSAHCEQCLTSPRLQMAQGKLCFKSQRAGDQRVRPHCFWLFRRTCCPTVTAAGFTMTSLASVNPFEIGMPCATAGRVSTSLSATCPPSTSSTTERLP